MKIRFVFILAMWIGILCLGCEPQPAFQLFEGEKSPDIGGEITVSDAQIPPTEDDAGIMDSDASQREYIPGPACFSDPYLPFTLNIPAGWMGVSSISFSSHAIIANYDPRELAFDHGAPLNMPADAIMLEIYGTMQSNWLQSIWSNPHTSSYQISEILNVSLGDFEGQAFSLTDSTGWSIMEMEVQVEPGKFLAINIYPIDSPALLEALSILGSLEKTGNHCKED